MNYLHTSIIMSNRPTNTNWITSGAEDDVKQLGTLTEGEYECKMVLLLGSFSQHWTHTYPTTQNFTMKYSPKWNKNLHAHTKLNMNICRCIIYITTQTGKNSLTCNFQKENTVETEHWLLAARTWAWGESGLQGGETVFQAVVALIWNLLVTHLYEFAVQVRSVHLREWIILISIIPRLQTSKTKQNKKGNQRLRFSR